MIPIQATISGYGSKPCTLFSAYDIDSQVLVISVEAKHQRERRDGCMVITNAPDIPRDMLFSETDLKKAIDTFFYMRSGMAVDGKSSKLAFSDKVVRLNPQNSIEKDGMDANGQKFRISENIACSQIAVLATCLYAGTRAGSADKIIAMTKQMTDIERLHHGLFITV